MAVNNTAAGLFGVGIIKSEYKFKLGKHDIGNDDPTSFYPHFREVVWANTAYTPRTSLISDGETSWQPYGTVGKVYDELPPYISRLLGKAPKSIPAGVCVVRPQFLESVIQSVEILRKQKEHKERAHESLVEDFFVAIGYRKHEDIKYRQGRVDIMLEKAGITILIAEVKAAWDISFYNGMEAIKQAYNYAHDQGVRNVIVTNGDLHNF